MLINKVISRLPFYVKLCKSYILNIDLLIIKIYVYYRTGGQT